tara:strand:+ start:14441 stop:15085 length:645 start_codon:yes stop_codon:yes gene_type:complete
MKRSLVILLLGLTACPGLQTRNEIKTKEGRRVVSEPSTPIADRDVSPAEEAAMQQDALSEIRRLNGKVEDLSFKLQQMEQMNDSTALQNRLDRIEQKLVTLSESLILLQQGKGASISSPASAKVAPQKPSGPYETAEELFRKSDWKAAILEYNRYRDNFPKGKKYADATYKIGVCFQELGMNSEANAFYSEVIEKFPKSKTAKSAKYRLNQLKK